MTDLFEVAYLPSQAPTWLGWSLLIGGTSSLAWLHGAGRFERQESRLD